MKSQEELKEIKEKVEALNNKLSELTEDELKQITGGEMRPGSIYPGMAVLNDCNGALISAFTECIHPDKKGSLNNCSHCRFN